MPQPPEIPEPPLDREAVVFAVLLALSGLLISWGFALVNVSAGLVVGGLLLAVWSWSVLHEDEQ